MLESKLLLAGATVLVLTLPLVVRDLRGEPPLLLRAGMLLRGDVRQLLADLLVSKPASAARLRYCSTKCLVADTGCGSKEPIVLVVDVRLCSCSMVKKPSLISFTGRMNRCAAFMGRKPGFAMRHLSSYA